MKTRTDKKKNLITTMSTQNTLSQLFLVVVVATLLNLHFASSEEAILPSTDEHGDYNGLDLIEVS